MRAPLPHRPPFLLVDRVLEREPGRRVVAEKLVTLGDPGPRGQVPGPQPVPAPLLLEMLAQAGGYLEVTPLAGDVFLAGVREATFHAQAYPGDRLRLEVAVEGSFGGLTKLRGVVCREGQELCVASLLVKRS